MTRLTNFWTPWQDFDRLRQEFSRCFPARTRDRKSHVLPAVNLAQGEHTVVLTTELPGLGRDDIDVTVTADTVSIRANRPAVELQDGEDWLVRERPTGVFERTVELPFEVETSSVEATYENGVLTLQLQRPEEQRPRKVTVKSA